MFAPKCFLTQKCLHLSACSLNNVCTQVQPRSDAYNNITSLQIDTYLYLCIHVHITFVDDYAVGKHRITNDPLLDQIITMDSHIFKMPLCLLLPKTVAEVNLPTTYRKHVKHTCEHQIRSTLFCSSLKLYIGFLSLIVFDPKLDHPDVGVINCINNIINLNPSDRKHIYLHQ